MSIADTTRTGQLAAARRVFALTLLLNLSVALAKLLWGFATHTLSMVADGFHSLLDASSNVVGIIGLSISTKPPDAGHPYGHRKFEALAAIFISFLMFLSSFEILRECLNRLLATSADKPDVTIGSYAIMLVTMVVNIGVSQYERRQAKALRSELLLADSMHTLSDVYATVGVLISLAAIQMQMTVVDVAAAILIVVIIFKAGFGIILVHLNSLVDAAGLDAVEIERLAVSVPGVLGCHKIRSRGMSDCVFVDMHLVVEESLSVAAAHEISQKVEALLLNSDRGIVDVVVHIEQEQPESKGACHEETTPSN